MTKLLFLIILLAGIVGNFLLVNNPAFAATPPTANQVAREFAGDSKITHPSDILTILNKITNFVFYLFLAITGLFIIVAAFSYLIGADDPEKTRGANRQLFYAAIAIVVAVMSFTAHLIIKNIMGI